MLSANIYFISIILHTKCCTESNTVKWSPFTVTVLLQIKWSAIPSALSLFFHTFLLETNFVDSHHCLKL